MFKKEEKTIKKLSKKYLQDKLQFIKDYTVAKNAADGSKVDSNANVIKKDIATLEAELYKQETIQLNREIIKAKLKELFGDCIARQYAKDIDNHFIYIHDETSLKPYCVSVTLYPFITNGTKGLGGGTVAPKNLRSFCGSFINLMYLIASNFAGAVATPEFLLYFDYFARKTYGADYLQTDKKAVIQELQGVVYSMNQPASARGNQSVFWNIGTFDKYYFESLFGDFVFPDGTKPDYVSVRQLQTAFMEWFTEERTKELLTFPVVTAAMLTPEGSNYPKDTEFADECALLMTKGLGFFKYQSPTVDSLSSCCRLRNELSDDANEFSYTLGAGGVATGSKQVITINMNRVYQRGKDSIKTVLKRVHKYLIAHNEIVKENIALGLIPAYTAGFISEDRQFLTVGLNGILESYEAIFHDNPYTNTSYKEYVCTLLKGIKGLNKQYSAYYGVKFNTEFVPAENLGVKNAKWDKEDGLYVTRDCYNSYLYPVEDTSYSILDKMDLHDKTVSDCLDGGSALHLNMEQLLSYEQARKLISLCSEKGVPFWDVNVLTTICNECGCIDARTLQECPKCHSKNLDYATRIIGYLKKISNFSSARQQEAHKRFYHVVDK